MVDRTSTLTSSAQFWDGHYATGGTSGTGSAGRLSSFKAEVLNRLIAEFNVGSAIEFGSGDGSQLSLIDYPNYLGLDTSPTAVELCRERFAGDASKHFRAYETGDFIPERADMSVSLDVVYHLLEDDVYERYMADLFGAARRLVVVYSSDRDEETEWPEVRHRRFTTWVADHAQAWDLLRRIPNRYPYEPGRIDTSWSDFFIFRRTRVTGRNRLINEVSRPPQGALLLEGGRDERIPNRHRPGTGRRRRSR